MTNRRTRRDLLALTGASLVSPALFGQPQESSSTAAPDLVVFNARVTTVDPRQPRADAFAIKNGRFLAVGSNADVRNLIRKGTPTWDAKGAAIVGICSLLQRMGRLPQYRVGGEISLHEMGGRPLVLIGALSNPWVMELNSSLRYQFAKGRASIVDTRTPGQEWTLPPNEPASGFDATVDYALVTRVFRADTRQFLIAAGGLKHFGTGAAGEFVTNHVYWREALAQLPADWPRRNLQVVLATRVIHKAAGPPKVLAVHWW
jgi:hypothetical protein